MSIDLVSLWRDKNPRRQPWFSPVDAGAAFGKGLAGMDPVGIELIGGVAALLTTLCWVPQAARTIRLRDTRAISLPAQLAYAAGLALWLVYGLMIASWPLIMSNSLTLLLVLVIIATKLRYG